MSAPAKKDTTPWLKKKLKKFNISEFGQGIVYAFLGFFGTLYLAYPVFASGVLILVYTSPVWTLFVLKKSLMFYWVHYIQHQFTAGDDQQGMLMEIKLPREISKSPRAMELVYEALHFRPRMATEFLKKWRGHVIPWYSFEIVSNKEGLKLYVWCWKNLQDQVEGALYAQYPTIQLIPVAEDYAKKYITSRGGPEKLNCWGCTYMLDKKDTYPIRTYYDYELDKDPKAELKHDPFVTVLEQLSAHEPYEQFWVQFMFQPEWTHHWKEDIKSEIAAIYESTRKDFPGEEGKKIKGFSQLKPLQFDIVRAMERSSTKLGFRASFRGIYITEGAYNSHLSQNLSNLFRPIGSDGTKYFNFIKLDGDKHTSGFDWPWEDYKKIRRTGRVKTLCDAWVARAAFAPPYIEDSMILTTEELATVFHIPGEDAKALGIKRIESTQKGAPPNLPI
jgi:hypothetical protein